MTLYLIKQPTSRHSTKAHDVAPDGKRPACGQANLIAGKQGWSVKEFEPEWNELCWHCEEKRRRDDNS